MKPTIVIIILIVIDGFVMAVVCRIYAILKRESAYKRDAVLSDDRLIYIRKMIDTLYTYKNNAERLQKHIVALMTVDVLMAYHVIMPSDRTKYDKINCRRADKLLCKLSDMGFTPRELCMIFSLNNINSVYVKISRMNKRLKESGEDPV